jgi:osmotically inducible lipoprotein OsmB
MKKSLLYSISALTLALVLAGCTGNQRQDVGIVGGAVVGGVAGSALTGGSAVGTVVGAAVGGVGGNELAK